MKITLADLKQRAYALRVLSMKATTQAGSGHMTSALSAADLVAALFFYAMKFDVDHPEDLSNDRFILSKGHAAPVLYAAWHLMGVLSFDELMTLRKFNSPLEGHPTPRFAYNEAATGSLGCGLSNGLGMALSSRLHNALFYTYVLLGDSEMTEGSVWEAIAIAAHYKVHNLIALVDLNGLGQSTQTLDDHNAEQHALRWRSFGWNTLCIDGHNMQEIITAIDKAKQSNKQPSVIIAKTLKGAGLEGIEGKQGYHGKALSKEELPEALQKLKDRYGENEIIMDSIHTRSVPPKPKPVSFTLPISMYKKESLVAPRKAFGETLAVIGKKITNVISLDAEVKNSTFAQTFEEQFPERFFQCFIAEQNMIGMAVGFAARGFIPVCSTFASFMTRAHDQIRMAAINRSPLRLVGSHVGVSIGEDGPSQMGLEDIALFRALPESIILYPCDAVSTHALLGKMIQYQEGISYLRLTRAETPVLYDPDTEFFIGGLHVLKESDDDKVCIIAAGITLHEALKAYQELKALNINVSVVDLYSIKPLDRDQLLKQALKASKRIITVEDHFIQGGLGEAVCYALSNEGITIKVLAVNELSRSGTSQELLAYHAIDKTAIVEAVHKIIEMYRA